MGNARAKLAEGIVDLIGASVAKGKGALEAWKHAPTVNIGLNVNDGSKLDPSEAIDALRKMGVDVTHQAIKQSGTEPTFVARLSRSLTNDEADMISRTLRQDAIAQIDHNGLGELHGPAAENWRPFNKEYFLGLDAEPALEQAYAGGGIVKQIPRVLDNLGFFSKAVEEAQRLPMAKGTGEQFKQMLLKNGVKADELKHTGADKWLSGKDTVAADDLVRYLEANKVKLGDMEYSKRRVEDDKNGHFLVEEDVYDETEFGPKFADGYQTKGGTDYREIGLTLPDSKHSGLPSYYNESHFPDENIIAHQRVKNYETPTREKVTLADETQSDWAQAGRENGFRNNDQREAYLAAKERLDYLQREYNEIHKTERALNPSMVTSSGATFKAYEALQAAKAEADRLGSMRQDLNGVDPGPFVDNTSKWTDLAVKRGLTEAARDGSDYYAWPHGGDVADRYNMRKVVDGVKYSPLDDKLGGWQLDVTFGGEHRNRVPSNLRILDKDLDQHVGRELAEKIRAGHGEVEPNNLRPPEEMEVELRAKNPFNPELFDEFGYESMVKNSMRDYSDRYKKANMRAIKGPDIPVGGEGHVGYYDNIMPKRVEEVMRKHVAPVKTEPVDLVTGTEQIPAAEQNKQLFELAKEMGLDPPSTDTKDWTWWLEKLPVYDRQKLQNAHLLQQRTRTSKVRAQGVRLTPEMRDKILKSGFPLFTIAASLGMSEEQLKQELEKPTYAEGGPVKKPFNAQQQVDLLKLFDPDKDIRDYENMRDVKARAPADEASMTHLGPKPRRDVKFNTFGTDFSLGDAPYDVAEGMETLADVGYMGARMAPYAMGPIPAGIAAGLDLAEAFATGDPLSAGAAVAFGPGGKLVKAVGTGTTAATMDPDEAEAGFIGTFNKWINKDKLQLAREMDAADIDAETIRQATGFFRGLDKKWRTERARPPGVMTKHYQSRADIPLSEVYPDPEMFEIYPHLNDWKFNRSNNSGGLSDAAQKRITIGDVSDPFYKPYGGYDGVMAHEIDHAIATHEGWAGGSNNFRAQSAVANDIDKLSRSGNIEDRKMGRFLHAADRKVKTSKVEDDAFLGTQDLMRRLQGEIYMRDPGEMMARNASRRKDFDEEMIRKTPPFATLDRPAQFMVDIDQGGGTSEAYKDMLNYIQALQRRAAMDAPPKVKVAPKVNVLNPKDFGRWADKVRK